MGGQYYYPFPHLCFKVAPCSSCSESHKLSFYTSGYFFHYRTWLVYYYDWLPQIPQVFVSKQVGCTPTSFLLLSIHLQLQCIRCMAIPTPHVDINRWASPQPVDQPRQCETFPLFVFSTQSPSSYSIPPIVLYPWVTLMYCMKVEKV